MNDPPNYPRMLSKLQNVPLAQIMDDPDNERLPAELAPDALISLTYSIGQLGLLDPIRLIRRKPKEYYISSGSRRVRASRLAGLNLVPAMIVQGPLEPLERAITRLASNMLHEDLSDLRIAATLRTLLHTYTNLQQEELGLQLGRSQGYVSNLIRLLALPPTVQKLLLSRGLTTGHALILLKIKANEWDSQGRTARPAAEVQEAFAQESANGGRTVHSLDTVVSHYLTLQQGYRPRPTAHPPTLPAPFSSVLPHPQEWAVAAAEERESVEKRAAVVLRDRFVVVTAIVDRLVGSTDTAGRLASLQLAALLALQANPDPHGRARWLEAVQAATTEEDMITILAAIGRLAVRPTPSNTAIIPSPVADWADQRWGINRAITSALADAGLLTQHLHAENDRYP